MTTVTVRYWAAARAAAGVAEEAVQAATVGDCFADVRARHGAELTRILGLASVLVDGVRVDRSVYDDTALPDGAVVEVLPPFAGG